MEKSGITPITWLREHLTLVLLVALIVAVQVVIALFGTRVLDRVITVMFINLMLVVSLQMFMGNSGVVSFAHVGFMGIGAYISIIFTLPERMKGVALPNLYEFLTPLELPFVPALIVAGLVAAVVAAVLGFPLMRLSGAASVIATFALLVIINVVLQHWNQLTNGPRTVFGVERLTTSWWTLGWAVLVVVVAYWFKESRLGLMLRASREDDLAAMSIGIDIVITRWIAFILSAFFCGVAGGLYAHFITSFGASAFYIELTFLVLAMLVIGGTASISGAVIGVLAVTLLSESVRSVETAINVADLVPGGIAGMTRVVVSITMLLILILRPSGITGGREIRTLFKRKSSTELDATKTELDPSL
jgi:branched-chain amino acid transport system permease protein